MLYNIYIYIIAQIKGMIIIVYTIFINPHIHTKKCGNFFIKDYIGTLQLYSY